MVDVVQSVTDELRAQVGDGQLSVIAWHGTPHTVDKFSTDKIGTGEGAQAYGYGLYFADRRAVGEQYRKSTTISQPQRYIVSGNKTTEFRQGALDAAYNGTLNKYISDIEKRLELIDKTEEPIAYENNIKNLLDAKKLISKTVELDNTKLGNLYCCDLRSDFITTART